MVHIRVGRGEAILQKLYSEECLDKPGEQEIENYGRQSPKLLKYLSQLDPEELVRRFPLVTREINGLELVYQTRPLIYAKRIVARKR